MQMKVAKLTKRLRRRGGFSLAETMLALLILLLVTIIVVTGIPTAIRIYQEAVDNANAQTLLSTSMVRLRDELCTASEITVTDSSISYRDDDGILSRLFFAAGDDGGIYKQYTDSNPDLVIPDALLDARLLISKQTSGNIRMYITYDDPDTAADVTFKNGVVTFSRLLVYKNAAPIAEMKNFQIRVLTDNT